MPCEFRQSVVAKLDARGLMIVASAETRMIEHDYLRGIYVEIRERRDTMSVVYTDIEARRWKMTGIYFIGSRIAGTPCTAGVNRGDGAGTDMVYLVIARQRGYWRGQRSWEVS
jgi:hypothetical protein